MLPCLKTEEKVNEKQPRDLRMNILGTHSPRLSTALHSFKEFNRNESTARKSRLWHFFLAHNLSLINNNKQTKQAY